MTELELGELARGRLAHDLAPEARDPHQMPGIPPAAVEERDARQSPEVDQVEQLVVGDLGAVEVQVEAAVRAGRELLGPLRELLLPLDEVDDARGRAQILDYHPAAVVEAGRVDALLVAEPRAVALGQLDARACLQVAGATDEPVLRRRRGPVREPPEPRVQSGDVGEPRGRVERFVARRRSLEGRRTREDGEGGEAARAGRHGPRRLVLENLLPPEARAQSTWAIFAGAQYLSCRGRLCLKHGDT
mmetsp:Transcript_3248/g.9551  ORF Transcript_3248/g.9551 Transcript_3248/m.9551 type:complete len:246 (+) Transcript_3248:884-1621(+)